MIQEAIHLHDIKRMKRTKQIFDAMKLVLTKEKTFTQRLNKILSLRALNLYKI